MTKQELVKFLVENFEEEGTIDLTHLDFSDYDVDVNISNMKVQKNLFQDYNEVGGLLSQSFHRVNGTLWQDNQKVGGSLWQDNQKVGGSIFQDKEAVSE